MENINRYYSKILIVDDSATSRMIIRRCLEMSGLDKSQYDEAEDPLVALDLVKLHQYDLIVTDLNMPRMDGMTFIKKLFQNPETAELPILVISSMDNDVLKKYLWSNNVKAIIHKPVSPETITEALLFIEKKEHRV